MAVDNAAKNLLNRNTLYINELMKDEINRKNQEINRAMSLTESNRLVADQFNIFTFTIDHRSGWRLNNIKCELRSWKRYMKITLRRLK